MLNFLTSSDSLLHYKKLGADVAAGTGLAIINDHSTLILNIVVILGRVLIEAIERRKKKNKNKSQDVIQ